MPERKQDMWHVIISAKDGSRGRAFDLRVEGAVSLPRPMTALEAADQALRVEVRRDSIPSRITVDVWGRAEIGSPEMRQCSAVADYDDTQKKYMRYVPWEAHEYEEIGQPHDDVTLYAFKS